MKNRSYSAYVLAMVVGSLMMQVSTTLGQTPPAAVPIVINDTGKFNGQVVICNYTGSWSVSSGTWTQTGANTGSETCWSVWDDYDNPVIANSGMNTVSASLTTSIGALADSTDFYTSPEIWSKSVGAVQSVTLNHSLKDFFRAGAITVVPVTISGSVTQEWSDSVTTSFSTTYEGSGSHTSTTSGGVKLKAIELTSGNSSTISSSISATVSRSRTLAQSGSTTKNMAYGPVNYSVSAADTIWIYADTVAEIQQISVQYWPDASPTDGIADSGIQTATYEARANPVVGNAIEVRP